MTTANYSGTFESGTVDGWSDGGQSTVGVEVGSPLVGSFSLKVERTVAQGTGSVIAQKSMDFTFGPASVGDALAASCVCQTTGANLSTARIAIKIFNSGGALVETVGISSFINVTSQNTLSTSGVIATGSSGGTIRVSVESDANALDNGTDRLRIDTVVVTQRLAKAVSGGLTPTGSPGQVFISGAFDVPLLRVQPWTRSNVYRM